jgi:hypothetical protein
MAYQLNTYNDITSLVNTIYEDAMLTARENSVMPGLVTNFRDMQGAATRKNAKYSAITFNAVNETDDLTSQAFTPSADQTLTPYEYAAQAFLTDLMMESSPWQAQQDATTELGVALGSKVDSLLVSSFSGLTAGTTGTGGTNITWANISAAITKLRAAYAPLPYVIVLHPNQWHCLGTAIAPGATVTNSPAIQDELVRNFFVANYGGVDIFLDGNISSGATCNAAAFSRNALALDWRRAPRLEGVRDPSRRGIELNMSAVLAYGVWRPAFGVLIQTAGTTPA